MLSDISLGRASNEVRQFVCDAYLRGARIGNAENCAFEGSTAVMTKRRYRDRWNRIMMRRVYCNGTRIHHSGFSTGGHSCYGGCERRGAYLRLEVSKKHNHSIKTLGRENYCTTILSCMFGLRFGARQAERGGAWCNTFPADRIKAKVRARGSRSQQWYAESRVQMLRKKCRTQSLWNLHLAGDWHVGSETMPLGASSHMMRVMLISNLAVDQVTFIALRPPISVSHKGRATCSPAVRQRYSGAPAAVAPGRERIEEKGVACILSRLAGAVLQGGAVTRCALVVSAPWGGRNSVGRPIDFPSFVEGDPTSVFLPETRRPRCPRGR